MGVCVCVCVSTQHKQCLGCLQNTTDILLTEARHIADVGNRELQHPHTLKTSDTHKLLQSKNTNKIGYITISPKINNKKMNSINQQQAQNSS
jgi:hypothetical protein